MASIAVPFADFVNVSLPRDAYQGCIDRVLEWAVQAGAVSDREGLARLGDAGTIKYGLLHRVGFLGLSGAALAALRTAGLFGEVLHAIGMHPHRVTLLHATLDVPVEAAPVIRNVYRLFKSGIYALTRKSIPKTAVTRVVGPAWPDWEESGTVYLGRRGAGVWAKVYDKRAHTMAVLQKTLPAPDPAQCTRDELLGFMDPGPLTRFELSLGRHVGCTLRDVDEPAGVFWHHVGDLARFLPPRPPTGRTCRAAPLAATHAPAGPVPGRAQARAADARARP
ncbi:hypothetical protein ES705_40549 [subsurface metagenome]